MRICSSKGCDNPTRGRKFNTKDNGKIYYERTCRACENTLRRYGMTSPERKAITEGGNRTPSRGPWPFGKV